MTVTVFLLALGATARITRFINADYLFRGVRIAAIKRWGPEHDIPYLLTCAWCAGLWVAAGVCTAAYFYGDTAAYTITAGALTLSWLYAVIGGWLDPAEGALVSMGVEDE